MKFYLHIGLIGFFPWIFRRRETVAIGSFCSFFIMYVTSFPLSYPNKSNLISIIANPFSQYPVPTPYPLKKNEVTILTVMNPIRGTNSLLILALTYRGSIMRDRKSIATIFFDYASFHGKNSHLWDGPTAPIGGSLLSVHPWIWFMNKYDPFKSPSDPSRTSRVLRIHLDNNLSV